MNKFFLKKNLECVISQEMFPLCLS